MLLCRLLGGGGHFALNGVLHHLGEIWQCVAQCVFHYLGDGGLDGHGYLVAELHERVGGDYG